MWLCSNKTLFTKIGGGHILSTGCHVLTVLESLCFWPLSCNTWESVGGGQRDGWAFSTVSSNSPTCCQSAGIGRDHEVNSPGTDDGRQALTFQRCPLASWWESLSGPSLDSPRCYYCKCRLKGRRWSWHCRLEALSGGLWGQNTVVNSCQCEELPGLLWSLTSFPRRQCYLITYLKNDRQLTSPLIWESQVLLAKYSARRRKPDLDLFLDSSTCSVIWSCQLFSHRVALRVNCTWKNTTGMQITYPGTAFSGAQSLNGTPRFWSFIWGLATEFRYIFIPFSNPSGRRKDDRISPFGGTNDRMSSTATFKACSNSFSVQRLCK